MRIKRKIYWYVRDDNRPFHLMYQNRKWITQEQAVASKKKFYAAASCRTREKARKHGRRIRALGGNPSLVSRVKVGNKIIQTIYKMRPE